MSNAVSRDDSMAKLRHYHFQVKQCIASPRKGAHPPPTPTPCWPQVASHVFPLLNPACAPDVYSFYCHYHTYIILFI